LEAAAARIGLAHLPPRLQPDAISIPISISISSGQESAVVQEFDSSAKIFRPQGF
jgi:hypothetical protein